MALTPDDVVNQKFTITKFRDGYDLDQVDDFLDSIVEELRAHEQEKQQLQAQVDELTEKLEACQASRGQLPDEAEGDSETSAEVTPAPQPAAPHSEVQPSASGDGSNSDAIKSSSMLQLALELHDKHVHEGETKRDELVREGETTARQLVEEARQQRAEQLRLLGSERDDFQNKIKELREFESEYRTTLKSYIQAQLRNLDHSQEPDASPNALN